MRLASSDAAILAELDTDKYICLKCIVEKIHRPGQHMPTAITSTYNRLGKMIKEGKVSYSCTEPCRNTMCRSKYRVMTHRLTAKGEALRKAAD